MRTVSVSPSASPDVEGKSALAAVMAAESSPLQATEQNTSSPISSYLSKILSPQMIGLVSLIGVITLWLTSSILTHDILKEYNKPVLMSFVSVASMQVYFVFLKVKDPLYNYLESKNSSTIKTKENITLKETAKIALTLFSVYFLGLYFVNASLKFTTLGSSSILGATCSFFTLFFGSILKVERFTLIKGLAVLVTFVGVVINSLPGAMKDSMSLGTQTWGNILALLGAICYASFLILLQKQTTDKTGLNRSILFAFIGLFTMIFCWPIFIFLSLTKQETLELPPNATIFVFLVLKTILGSVIPSYLWNVTFALTSPLYIAVGTSLTIPLNFVADHFMGNPVGWSESIGALFVTAGCLIMNLAEIH